MASAEAAETPNPSPEAPASKGRGGVGMMIAAVLLSVAASGGVAFFVTKSAADADKETAEEGPDATDEEAAAPPAPAVYLPLEPAFVVNLDDPEQPRFLQAEVQLMGRDPLAMETIKGQLPRIRNAILMLLGQQRPADLVSREGKERLQSEVLAEVQKVMEAETGKPAAEAVYFTSFVMQ